MAGLKFQEKISEVVGRNLPLVVDLDGTLSQRDLLHSAIFSLIFHEPRKIPQMALALLKGPIRLKNYLVDNSNIDISSLPWNMELIDQLEEEAKTREVVLCSGSHEKWVKRVSDEFPLFSNRYGSTTTLNLAGKNKAEFLVSLFGEKNFDYVGDSKKDRLVTIVAAKSVIIGRSKRRTLEKIVSVVLLLRPNHWIKNTLVFLPTLAAHSIFTQQSFAPTALLFAIMNLLVSGTYIMNDLADLNSDSNHENKRNRPLVSGKVGIPSAASLSVGLILGSVGLAALFLPPSVTATLLAYLVVTTLYSFKLKKVVGLDVISILLLFELRIVAGTFAASVAFSFWLMCAAFFTFASLASAKRYVELDASSRGAIPGRGYLASDAQTVKTLGVGAGLLATLVLCLYLDSAQVQIAYSSPFYLWPIIPAFFYWISHVWFSIERGKMKSDPIEWALSDRASQVVAVVSLCLALLAL